MSKPPEPSAPRPTAKATFLPDDDDPTDKRPVRAANATFVPDDDSGAFRALAREAGGVVEVDLGDTAFEAANKFIAYDLFPEARYTVVVSKDAKRT